MLVKDIYPGTTGSYPAQLTILGSIAVFGSRARGTSRPDSDLDLLVEWSGPVSLLDYAGLRSELEELTGRRVELANRELLKPALAPSILGEAVPV